MWNAPARNVLLALLVGVMCACVMPTLVWAQDEGQGGESAEAQGGEEVGDGGAGSLRRSNRMEFDARLVRGETAGSGAVFLFQRAPRVLPSMVARRTSTLQDSVDAVLTPRWEEERAASERALQPLQQQNKPETKTSQPDSSAGTTTPATKKPDPSTKPPKKPPVRKK